MSGMLGSDPSHFYLVSGPLCSYTNVHFAFTIALGGRYWEQLHLKDVEDEAQRHKDTCPRLQDQEVVELRLELRSAWANS